MAGPYDSVVTIGGQSFVDGIWRILGPALQGITNPLPISIPGFTNAQLRITQLVPVFPGTPPASGGMNVLATVELVAEALLHVTTTTDSVNIGLGDQDLTLTSLTGSIDIPDQTGTLSDIVFTGGGPNIGTGTGTVELPAVTGTLSGGSGSGTIDFPDDLVVPGIPLPAIVPVAVDLTPSAPLVLPATVTLTVSGPSAMTRFGLLFSVQSVSVGPVAGFDPNLAAVLTPILQTAVDQIVAQLAIPTTLPQPTVDQAAVATLVAPIPTIVAAAFDDALTRLLAETGRLTFPTPGTGASCDVVALPTQADAQLTVLPGGTYALQIGFKRASSSDITSLPPVTAGVECNVLVGNSFVLELLCCLVERLPSFSIQVPATSGTVDINGTTHLRCCNFTTLPPPPDTAVTATVGGISIGGGGLSVCVDGAAGATKTFSIVGSFSQGVPSTLPFVGTIATVTVGFTLPVSFDLDDASAVANLRLMGTPAVTATVSPNITALIIAGVVSAILGLLAYTIGGGLVGAIVGAVLGILMPIALVIVILLLVIACDGASHLIRTALPTVLGGASLLRSPVAIPPALFEAFGRLSPVSVTVDDLVANSVLHTPTSPWALLPRISLRGRVPPTHGPRMKS